MEKEYLTCLSTLERALKIRWCLGAGPSDDEGRAIVAPKQFDYMQCKLEML